MNPTDFARPKTSYRKLHAFLKAEAIYDLTYYFLQGHIAKSDRTYDQMLQAARSGKRLPAAGQGCVARGGNLHCDPRSLAAAAIRLQQESACTHGRQFAAEGVRELKPGAGRVLRP